MGKVQRISRSDPTVFEIGLQKAGQPAKRFGELTPAEQKECACKLARGLKLLANPNRLQILVKLMSGSFSVTQLQKDLHRSQPAVSSDLAILRHLGFVEKTDRGRPNGYEICPQKRPKVFGVLAALQE